jgi:hypothetical protein
MPLHTIVLALWFFTFHHPQYQNDQVIHAGPYASEADCKREQDNVVRSSKNLYKSEASATKCTNKKSILIYIPTD